MAGNQTRKETYYCAMGIFAKEVRNVLGLDKGSEMKLETCPLSLSDSWSNSL